MADIINSSQRRIAMLIDGDNAQPSMMDKMIAETSKHGVVTIRRIYGDWTESSMKSWKQTLHTYAVQPIQQFRYTVGKNATDSAMIIDAMDILYTAGVDGFCLVSSDSDYTRLATRIREKNLFVMGIGKELTTPRAFVNACEVFVYIENLVEEAEAPPEAPSPKNSTDTKAAASPTPAPTSKKVPRKLFKEASDLSSDEDGWIHLGQLGTNLRKLDPAFDPRTYGHRQLLLLVQAHPKMFEVRKDEGIGQHYVRLIGKK